MNKIRTKETSYTDTYEITDKDLLELLQTKYELGIEKDSEVRMFVKVPGGGDWSNMELDIGSDVNLQLVVKTRRFESSKS